MGRTNGKLIPFLKESLQNATFCNLKWKDTNYNSFSLELPRYEKRKDLKLYEKILIEWFITNNREYPGYSRAKAVIQAALKKSVYLVSLKSNDSELHYRFATKDEAEEKRKQQKLQSDFILHVPLQETSQLHSGLDLSVELFLPDSDFSLQSPSRSPSVSSGYQSGNDDFEENMPMTESNISEDPDLLNVLDDLLLDEEDYNRTLNNISMGNEEAVSLSSIIEDRTDGITLSDGKLNNIDFMQPATEIPMKPVEELTAIEVNTLENCNTYWLCTRKLHIDSTLLLICEKQVIQDQSQGFVPGQIYLNNVLEPGECYSFQKMLEIDGKCYLFLLRNN